MTPELRKVRIKKGVKPYGGRLLTLVRINEFGRVEVEAPTKPGAFGRVHGGDVRIYRQDEVDLETGTEPEIMTRGGFLPLSKTEVR